MQTNINWALLKMRGSVKEINVPWTTEEWVFVSGEKIADETERSAGFNKRVEAARAGFLSVEEYEKAQTWNAEVKNNRSPHDLSADELLVKAKELGVEFTNEMDYGDLADAVEDALSGKEKKVTSAKKKTK